MLRSFGGPELLIILLIVLLLFGAGRIGRIASELGGGIRSFREGLKGKEEDEDNEVINKELKEKSNGKNK